MSKHLAIMQERVRPQQIWVYHIIGDIFYLLHLQIVIDMITGYCIDLAKFDVLYVSMKFE